MRPNISIRGGRSVAIKPEISVTEPAVTLNPAPVTVNATAEIANDTVVTVNDTLVTPNDPVLTVREPELQQSKEQELPLEPQPKLKIEEVLKTEAVKLGANNVEVKCSPRKLDTPALSLGGSTGTNTVNVVRRRNRIKPPVLVTRKRTCPVDLERASSITQSSQNDADGRIPSVPHDDDKMAALQQESKEKIDEPDKCQPAQAPKVAEDTFNVHVENLGTVDTEKAQDLVKLTPSSGDESKPLSSPKVGKAVGPLRRVHFPKAKPNLVDTGRHVRIRYVICLYPHNKRF